MTESKTLDFHLSTQNEGLVVHLIGRIECVHSHRIEEIMVEVREEKPKKVVLDFTDVTYIDNSGLGALVSERSRFIREEILMGLSNISTEVRHIFIASKLNAVFNIFDSIEDALAEL